MLFFLIFSAAFLALIRPFLALPAPVHINNRIHGIKRYTALYGVILELYKSVMTGSRGAGYNGGGFRLQRRRQSCYSASDYSAAAGNSGAGPGIIGSGYITTLPNIAAGPDYRIRGVIAASAGPAAAGPGIDVNGCSASGGVIRSITAPAPLPIMDRIRSFFQFFPLYLYEKMTLFSVITIRNFIMIYVNYTYAKCPKISAVFRIPGAACLVWAENNLVRPVLYVYCLYIYVCIYMCVLYVMMMLWRWYMFIDNDRDYKRAEARFSRLFDRVIDATGRYSAAAIAEALGSAGAAEFYALQQALADYDQRQAFRACLRSGDYRS